MCGNCGRFHDSIFRMATQRAVWNHQLAFPEFGEFKTDKTDRSAKSVSKKCCKWCHIMQVLTIAKERFATVSLDPKRQHVAFHTHKHYIAHVPLLPSLLSVCTASALL